MQVNIKTFKDGNSWCAVLEDSFVNIQESVCGFGDTKDEATENLSKNILDGRRILKEKELHCLPDYALQQRKKRVSKFLQNLRDQRFKDIGAILFYQREIERFGEEVEEPKDKEIAS